VSILQNQRNILLDEAIQSLLSQGIDPTVTAVEDAYNLLIAERDLTAPLVEGGEVSPHTSASASLQNATHEALKKDLGTLYTNLLKLTSSSMKMADRWKSEITRLDSKLSSLENRIDNLLLSTQDTEGYFSFVSDNFSTTDKVDLASSSVVIDLGRGLVTVGPTTPGATRVFINSLKDQDVNFSVISQKNLQAVVDAPGSLVRQAFDDSSKFWQSRVYMSTKGPVLAELKVKLADTPVSISRIRIELHVSNATAPIQVTPLYSVDNFNFSQLPTENFSLSVLDKATFNFESVDAKYVKFVLAKEGFDTIDGLSYIYEFGANEISFFSEGYEEDTAGLFYSKPLFAADPDGNPAPFNKISFDACDSIPADAHINYALAATTTTTPPSINDWVPVDPQSRMTAVNPSIINFADLVEYRVGEATVDGDLVTWTIAEPIHVSYDPDSVSAELINPGATFKLVESGPVFTSKTASGIRYLLTSNHDRILDHQIKDDPIFDLDRLTVLRNHGFKGNKTRVRGVQTGWGFSEPYYSSLIEIKNKDGQSINFGDKEIIIDGISMKGQVLLSQGFHPVLVHKDNWLDTPGALTTLSALKAVDHLYPFNHKYLIEGYNYPSNWSEETVYKGVDLFCEYKMKRIGPFDLLNSAPDDQYNVFALDFDVKDGARDPSRVVLVKTDATIPDFKNENFVLRLKVNTGALTFNYIWLKAEFKTSNPSVAPTLDSYRIKLGK
jgi:hypothetical protein